jgi:SAM-dependent methyltransferase
MSCRYCNSKTQSIIDLGYNPPSNQYINKKTIGSVESFYPLGMVICQDCGLLQTSFDVDFDIMFDDEYSYFSSYSKTWISHCEDLVDEIEKNYEYQNGVVEIASNDGYLLDIFKKKRIQAYGIEPTKSTSSVAIKKGLDVVNDFLTCNLADKLALERGRSDILIANNVLAHVPNIRDFVESIYKLLSNNGVAIIEFPYAKNLVDANQFDTIYHEHYSYFTLSAINKILTENRLLIFNVKKIATHGGSLRLYLVKDNNHSRGISNNVHKILLEEKTLGVDSIKYFRDMQNFAFRIKIDFLQFLIDAKNNNKKVIAYGAAAKGNTLLNYCGIKSDLIEFVIDKSPFKSGKLMPGSHIPIKTEDEIIKFQPDFIVILPWNLLDEITRQLNYTQKWNCKFVTAIPSLTIL